MLTMIGAWFGKNVIPWKTIGVCLVALGITAVVFFGYRYVTNLQTELTQTKIDLALESVRAESERMRANGYERQHDEQIARLQQLEADRSQVAEEVSTLRDKIRSMTLEEDMTRDPDKAVSDFVRRSGELNRLLERASRKGGSGRGEVAR